MLTNVNRGDWIAVAALAVAPTLAGIGAIYRFGQLTRTVDDLAQQVADLRARVVSLENWIRGRNPRR